jgi:type I restriction enzyme S subunit
MNNYQLSVKSYPVYKDSTIAWLGDVPEHWELSRIKQKGTVRGRVGWKALKAEEYVNEGYIFLSTPNIKEKDIDFENVNYITYERYIESPEIMIQEGDILLTKDGSTLGTTNIVSSLPREATVNSSIAVVRFNKDVFKKYIYYQILSEFIQNKINLKKSGMGVPHLFQRDINNFFILIPPLSEQQSIAAYLDTKTAQCDRKIDLLTQKATQYGKLKQSLINETVTRGLDKSVPMKDSGIEWIGDVPEHWEIQRLHDIAVHQKTKNIGLIEKNLLSLSYGKIKRRDIDTSFGLLPESFETYQIVEEGNIILRLTDLQNDQRSLRVGLAKEKGIITSAYLCLKFLKNIHPVFAYYLLFIYDISKVFYWFGGGLRQSMKFDDVKVFPFVIPPLSEQKEIADYLDTKTAQIDQIIQTINAQIEKLKELRKT